MTDESALYTLATRLIPRRMPPPYSGPIEAQLLAGQLPDDLPFELPVPPAIQIIGAVVEGPFVTVFLDSDLAAKDILAFYQDALSSQGWTTLEAMGPAFDGFVEVIQSSGSFCQTPRGPRLNFFAEGYPNIPTQVRLDLDLRPDVPCQPRTVPLPPPHPQPVVSQPAPLIQALAPPPGAVLRAAAVIGPEGVVDVASGVRWRGIGW